MLETTERLPREETRLGENQWREEVEDNKRRIRKVVDDWGEGKIRNQIARATDVILPNVKELTEKFARGLDEFTAKPSPTPSTISQEFKKESISIVRKESDLESSKHNRAPTEKRLQNQCGTSQSQLSPNGEIQTNGLSSVDNIEKMRTVRKEGELDEKNHKLNESVKLSSPLNFPRSVGKEVHSLTARSISKEFREELKNNTSRRSIQKLDKNNSGEGNHPTDIVSESSRSKSPTLSIDLQSKRKFWEDIISNAQK